MKKFIILFLIFACTKSTQDNYESNDSLSILFTGNINAEIEPCGCRQFPLGGIDNVLGAIEREKKKSSVLFIDTGDSFFQGSFIPKNEEKSSMAKADALVEGLNLLKLRLKVLGDQDFSGGLEILKRITSNSPAFNFIATNASSSFDLPHLKYFKADFYQHKFFFLGVTNPATLQSQYQKFFGDVEGAIENQIKILKKEHGFDSNNSFHHLFVLSHSGEKFEKNLATKFKEIDWILGSHSMNFTQKPTTVERTKIAQMLSRNHYLGKIKFQKNASQPKYSTIEISQDLAKLVPNNKLSTFIKAKKVEINKIQSEEQTEANFQFYQDEKIPTATACMDCHDAQGTFWQETPHSLAYITLKKNNKNHDLDCLKCHSLGANNPKGYQDSNNIVPIANQKNYWKEVFKAIAPNGPVRDLAPERIKEHAKSWYDIDLKYNVEHNYANVQCLNCHQQDIRHLNEPDKYKNLNAEHIKTACIKCHNSDQSDHWYDNGQLNKEKFEASYKKMSCPKSL